MIELLVLMFAWVIGIWTGYLYRDAIERKRREDEK